MMAFSNTKLTTIPLHSQCIKYLNQLLEELNDWVHKTKWVVESLWALSLKFGLTLLDQGFEEFPSLFLVKSCPISLFHCIASCGYFIKFHIYMMSQFIMCLARTKNICINFNRRYIKC